MNEALAEEYLADAIASFRAYKKLTDKAIAQITDEELFVTLDEESNSIAVVMKHLAGNMISRWTDFLTSDGEKPERNRDMEFVMLPETTREDMLAYWEKGWACTFAAIEPLTADDLMWVVGFLKANGDLARATVDYDWLGRLYLRASNQTADNK